MLNQLVEAMVRRVRKEGEVHVETKAHALELVKYAEKTYGYRFSISPTGFGYLVIDES